MKNKNFFLFICMSIVFIGCLGFACNKQFDEPPLFSEPGIPVNTTIKELKLLHAKDGFEQIKEDKIVSGVIIADDRSGNFYKSIVVQDESGGITIRMDGINLYTSYPVGRKVFIRCKGLYLGDYNGLVQLGGGVDKSDPARPTLSPIAYNLLDKHMVKGSLNNEVVPKIVRTYQLTTQMQDSFQSCLIQLNGFEFGRNDTIKTYADATLGVSAVNLSIRNCLGNSIILRTSSYADFAGLKLPEGNGTIVAVYTVFGSTKQLNIRDTSDVKFFSGRCQQTPVTGTFTSIENVKKLHSGSDIKLDTHAIKGVVISDMENKNTASGNIIIQEGSFGVSVYFGGIADYNLGDSIHLDITGDSLINYKGALQIKRAFGSGMTAPVATGKTVVPKKITIRQLIENISDFEYSLVTIEDAIASGNSTFSGNQTLTDATGEITLYTAATASFAADSLPLGPRSWTGFAGVFGELKEFQIRSLKDISKSPEDEEQDGTGIQLNSAPLVIDFDNVENNGLPDGVFVKLSSKASALGNDGSFVKVKSSWSNTAAGFKNFASATDMIATSDGATQNKSTNRALGVRQTGTTGYDPGAAFVFLINNTSGKSNLTMEFLLQSLDNSIGRSTAWKVDYAIGDPTMFTNVAASPESLTTGPVFSNTHVKVAFGSALDNQNKKIWIRIVTLNATTGTGSRPSTAIDDVKFSWDP